MRRDAVVIRRRRRLLLTFAVAQSAVVTSCNGASDDDGATSEAKSGTSSTLPPSPSAAAAVGVAPSGTAAAPGVPAGASRGRQEGSRPSASSPTPLDAPGLADTPTTLGTSAPTTPTTMVPGLPPEKCPDAKTCRRHVFAANMSAADAPRWVRGPDGFVVVRYHINPVGSGLPDDQVRGAAERAFATITGAAPTLRIEFTGFTGRVPTPGDGFTDIGFVNANTGHALPQGRDGAIVEADMFLGAGGNWTWSPCEQRDGSCTPVCIRNTSGTGCRSELQSAITHEGLHWFWLGDMVDNETDRELTMSPRAPFYDRWRSTLALGDVLGLRALYPTSAPMPPIYSP